MTLMSHDSVAGKQSCAWRVQYSCFSWLWEAKAVWRIFGRKPRRPQHPRASQLVMWTNGTTAAAVIPPAPDPRFPQVPSWKTELRELAPNVYAYIQGGGPHGSTVVGEARGLCRGDGRAKGGAADHDLRGQADLSLREDGRGAHLHGPVSYLGRHHSLSTPAQDHVGRRHRILLRRAVCPERARHQLEGNHGQDQCD